MPVYITDEIILMILMKKILMKKIKFRMCLVFIFLMSQIIYSDI